MLAELARGRLRAKVPALRQALEGRVRPHHRVLLQSLLEHIEYLEAALARLTREIEQCLAPSAEAVALLHTLPAMGETSAAVIVAEIGVNMSRFPSAKHLARLRGGLPRQQTKRGQTAQWQNHSGQRLVARCPGRSGLGAGPDLR